MTPGRCCSGELCTDFMLTLNPEHKCVKCKKMVHCVCGVLFPGSDNDYMCLL